MITVLAGGVGAARFLSGLLAVVDPHEVTAIVNVGDDTDLHGLHISPDLDTVTYTLAGAINPETGWGLRDETWQAMAGLGRYGGPTWFNLGDRDLGTHLYRTGRRAQGDPLSAITASIASSWGLQLTVLPVTDDRLRTLITVTDTDGATRTLQFQEYFVGRRHDVPVQRIDFDGAATATPAPGVAQAIADADVVVIAPSNPLVSIGPILAVPAVAAALTKRREATVAISPIVGGAAVKGPAARMMTELGHEASTVGVARLYREVASHLVIDQVDAATADAVRAAGMEPIVTDTLMHEPRVAAALARTALAAIASTGAAVPPAPAAEGPAAEEGAR